MKKSLEQGKEILFSYFGKLSVEKKRKRRDRKPSTGKNIQLKARLIVTFTCSGNLRKAINN